MDLKKYFKIIALKYQKILKDNLLFWNLWNTNYLFEFLDNYKEEYPEYYNMFTEINTICWKFNDSHKISVKELYITLDKYYPFIDDNTLDDLDDFNLPEVVIKELTYSFNTIYDGIKSNKRYGDKSSDASINIISVILESNKLDYDDTNIPILKNEIDAQIKLIQDLSKPQAYTYKDRNIYRDKVAMTSIKFNENY